MPFGTVLRIISIISFQQIAGTPPVGLVKQSCAGLDLDPGNPRISGQLWACSHSRYLDSSCVDCPPSDRREEAPRRSCRYSSFQGQNAGAFRIGETGQNKKCSGGRNSLRLQIGGHKRFVGTNSWPSPCHTNNVVGTTDWAGHWKPTLSWQLLGTNGKGGRSFPAP